MGLKGSDPGKGGNYKIISIAMVSSLVLMGMLGFLTFNSHEVEASTTIYVGSGPGNDTKFIMDAIVNYANPGDTVFVYSGVYFENLWINKTITLIGEDRNTTIIEGGGLTTVTIISTNWVNITGFTIRNGTRGIFTTSSSFLRIHNNEIYGNGYGTFSQGSSYSTFTNNIVHDQIRMGEAQGDGLFFQVGPYYNNYIGENILYNNAGDGIHLEGDPLNNIIINNTIYNNTSDGIFIGPGVNNSIIDNIIHHNGIGTVNPRGGIHLDLCYNNSITGNRLHSNGHGILWWTAAWASTENTIAGNMIYNNKYGIRIWDAEENTFVDNQIFNNNHSVHMVRVSSRNTFINCTFTNATVHVYMRNQSLGNKFINCSLSNGTQDDFNLSDNSNAYLLNTTFNKTSVYYGDTLSSLNVNWFMHVKVIYYNGSPAPGADIWINDTFDSSLFSGPVDFLGWFKWFIVNEYIEQDKDGDHIGDRIYSTPHHVTGTDGVYWGYADPNMDISKVVLIILGIPPPLLPPTNLTTKVVNNGNYVELEWDPSSSLVLDHYLIYRCESATEFDFTSPYNTSISWPNPKINTWVDPDPGVTAVDDDFYYIIRAANSDESDISSTSNTAGVWTRTFQPGISSFSLLLEPFVKKDTEFNCQDMNASYIKWMNQTTHMWVRHEKGDSGNNAFIEVGKGYEIGFLGKSLQTKYTFCGMPAAMIKYDDGFFSGFDSSSEADSLYAIVNPFGDVTLIWNRPMGMDVDDHYKIYRATKRDGFFDGSAVLTAFISYGIEFWIESAVAQPGTQYYYMVIPENELGVEGTGTYSIGIWTKGFLSEYDSFGIPLKIKTTQSVDWYLDNVQDSDGINYYIEAEQRWCWHSTRMPGGIYDPLIEMCYGYQISTSGATKFTFIGV